jgi:hypothetical protein
MIAEYERAQILERSRRGKRHRAHAGEVSVMSGAPYGYRYIRKTDEALAAYIVDEAEAGVVRRVFEMYTVERLSIAEITRRLNRQGNPTRKGGRWERSVVWAMLFPVQPAQIAQPWQAILPPPGAGRRRRAGHLQISGQMFSGAALVKPQDVVGYCGMKATERKPCRDRDDGGPIAFGL